MTMPTPSLFYLLALLNYLSMDLYVELFVCGFVC